jgi:hypothetical protein
MTTRFDLFTPIHKALRAALFDAMQQVARCDFARAPEAAAVAAALLHLSGFLSEHADHEDRVLLPEVARLCGVLAADLQAAHARVGGLEQEVLRLSERLAGASPAERLSLGRRLHDSLGTLIAEQLLHMKREEVEVNRLLWAHCSDAELLELHGRVVAAIPPARMQEWLALLLPAVNGPERRALEAIATGHVA